jgi:hypothetical protein
MKRHRPLICSGFDIPRSKLAFAALCGLAVHPAQAEVLLNLDATSLADGPLTSWTNTGSVTDNFAVSDEASAPVVSSVAGVKGVNMPSAAFFTGPAAPERVTADGARTIEAWVYNPSGSNFETIIAWGRRGTDNSNSSFSHGVHPTWGAFGGWGAADLDW